MQQKEQTPVTTAPKRLKIIIESEKIQREAEFEKTAKGEAQAEKFLKAVKKENDDLNKENRVYNSNHQKDVAAKKKRLKEQHRRNALASTWVTVPELVLRPTNHLKVSITTI